MKKSPYCRNTFWECPHKRECGDDESHC